MFSIDDADKPGCLDLAIRLRGLGFTLIGTAGSVRALEERGVACTLINKQHEGGDTTVDAILDGRVQLVFCTTRAAERIPRSRGLRRAALQKGVPYFTTLVGARAAVGAIERLLHGRPAVRALQDYHL
jgi:carbamoyl-phosphate synthase large subunit